MSRVQTLWIPDMESYEPYIRSLCHMARALENSGLNYGALKRVVFIGLSKRSVESYVKQLLNSSTLPNTLVCFGVDDAPNSHTEFSFLGSHVVLMHDLSYAGTTAMHRVSQRVIEIILSLKQLRKDRELKNGALSLVYQNPLLWSTILDSGASVLKQHPRIQFAENLASSIEVGDLMACSKNEDYQQLHAARITIGREFLCIKTDALISKLGTLIWSLGTSNAPYKDTYTILMHEEFRRALFEEYLLGDFQSF